MALWNSSSAQPWHFQLLLWACLGGWAFASLDELFGSCLISILELSYFCYCCWLLDCYFRFPGMPWNFISPPLLFVSISVSALTFPAPFAGHHRRFLMRLPHCSQPKFQIFFCFLWDSSSR